MSINLDVIKAIRGKIQDFSSSLLADLDEMEKSLRALTEAQPGEDWRPQKDGGMFIPASEIKGELRMRLAKPGDRLDTGGYHYRAWTGRDGKLMVSRYLVKESTGRTGY